MQKQELFDLFKNFENKKILIIGDVMIDAYVWGKVSRISPEAPVPIVNSQKKENRLGGAANVALNIKALGAKAILASVIGNDNKGDIFNKLLNTENLSSQGIIISPERITTTKTRIISNHQQLLRLDREIDTPLNETEEDLLISKIHSLVASEKIDAIVFEDYDKGVITPKIIHQIVKLANEKEIPTLVDPKKRNFLEYKNVTFFKPNFKELKEGTKIDIKKSDFEALFEATKQLNAILNAKYIVTTLSDLGVFVFEENQYEVIPAEIRQIADVSGAGDTVVSVSALCLASGIEVNIAARIANLAGGLVCEKVGVVPIDKALLLMETINYFL
jgi:rfaE bifunctional protein kinase chain/domain